MKVAFVEFREADERIHRAEARAQRHVAGVLFLHVHDEVLAIRHDRVGSGRVSTFSKYSKPFQPLLAELDAHHVEHFARRHGQFAPDDLVLGLDVAVDFDLLDVGLLPFVDLEFQVHGAGFGVGNLGPRSGCAKQR